MNPQSMLETALDMVTITRLWLESGLPGKPGRSCRSPFRPDDKNPSFSVFVHKDGRERAKDHATGEVLDAVGFLQRIKGCDRPDACRDLIEYAGVNGEKRKGWPSPLPAIPPRPTAPELVALDLSALEVPTDADLVQICLVRRWMTAGKPAPAALRGLRIAADRGVLKVGEVRDNGAGVRVWYVCDECNAQARRMDGERFHGADGVRFKAKSIRGSCASWPVGASTLRCRVPLLVMWCEGAPDLLAAYVCLGELEAGMGVDVDDVVPVAMLGAKQAIHPEALPLFDGIKVMCYPHEDDSGREGMKAWVRALRAAGAVVVVRGFCDRLPPGGKDLADLVAHGLKGDGVGFFTPWKEADRV